jgi:CTP:molybdopterin cytidylyltransferase MocA
VGEEGPELIIPSQNGTVLPNEVFDDARGALRGSATTNADDASDAFFAAAGALERNTQVINNRQSTTQQETSFNSFTEAMMRPGQSTVRFETVNVGDMPMVTREEALRIGAESAKAAEANVFSALRNKPSVRRSIGMK